MAKNKNVFNMPKFRVNDEIRGYNEVRIVGEGIESKVAKPGKSQRGWSWI